MSGRLTTSDGATATLSSITVKDKRGVTYTYVLEGPPRVVEITVYDVEPETPNRRGK